MFKRLSAEQEKLKKESYDRVYRLHESADFLFYIDDAYLEEYKGENYVKLEGVVAKGEGRLTDTYELYSCNGNKKADVTVEEFYVKSDSVEKLYGGDKRVAIYPKEQEVAYKAGDILCRMVEE